MAQVQPTRVRVFVLALAGVATLAFAAAGFELVRHPGPWTWNSAIGAAAFLGLFIGLERLAVSFMWRGHRHTTALTECAVVMGYVLLNPLLLVVLAPAARGVMHFAARRPLIKGIFNTTQQAVAAGAGAAVVLGLSAVGTAPLLAALGGTIVYVVAADALVAMLFAVVERVNPLRVYHERMMPATSLAVSAGIPAGVALYALFILSPFALLAAIPLLAVLVRASALAAGSDRELEVRRRLADEARALVGTRDDDVIALSVLATTADLLDAGRAEIAFADGRSWARDNDDAVEGRPPMRAEIVGREGHVLGTLSAWGRRTKRRPGVEAQALLRVIAGQAATAFESARSLAEVAAQRDVITKQEKLSALGTLLASVAHEVNNPLSYMRLRLQITRTESQKVMDSDAAPETKAIAKKSLDTVETMQRGVDRLAALSHSLKVVARPGDGQRRATDLNDVLGQVLTILRATEKQIGFDVALAPDLPAVHANAGELHQVFLNLVKNATEALKDAQEPRIRVETRLEGESALVLVTDNGPGIPEDVRPRLFTPFVTTKSSGTGLGLSISQQIVVAHGGAMDFESTVGKGTTFRVRLPLAPPAAPEAPVTPASSP